MAGWGETKSLNNNDSGPKLTEQMELMSFPDNKWVRVRFIGPIASTCNIYVNRKKKTALLILEGFRLYVWIMTQRHNLLQKIFVLGVVLV